MSKKILYVCGGRSFHAERSLRKFSEIVQCWRAMGHEVLHLCGGDVPGGAPLPPSVAPGATSSKPTRCRKWYRGIGLLSPLERSISEYRDIRHDRVLLQHILKVADSFRPDLICERSCRLHCAGLLASRQIGVPHVLEWIDYHGLSRMARTVSLFGFRARALEKRKHRETDYLIVESELLIDELAEQGVDRRKLLVAHNAVDLRQFAPDVDARQETRRALGVKHDEILAGYLGSYAYYHDTKRLVLAANVARRQANSKIKILMVGDGLEYRDSYFLAKRRGLLDSSVVTMSPKVPPEEVPGILSALDIAVLPGSTDIICPIKVQEYMAAELPTVLPDYPANREVITHGETGLLFAPKDEKALAEALMQLADDPASCKGMGQNARKEVEKRFTWKKTWGAALQEVLARIDCNKTI